MHDVLSVFGLYDPIKTFSHLNAHLSKLVKFFFFIKEPYSNNIIFHSITVQFDLNSSVSFFLRETKVGF